MVDQLNLEKSLEITSQCTVKNRIFKASMGEGLATWDGSPTKELFNLYQVWAQGGSGLQVTGKPECIGSTQPGMKTNCIELPKGSQQNRI
jgi:2,4-dienoyl-CoA reductase-like NADH-dependent reductase (Old Yellow Enzyme family)